MAKPIVVTGAAGCVGAAGRTVTELLLKHSKAVRAMVRTEDERAQALRELGAGRGCRRATCTLTNDPHKTSALTFGPRSRFKQESR